jgi:hypothetical protein
VRTGQGSLVPRRPYPHDQVVFVDSAGHACPEPVEGLPLTRNPTLPNIFFSSNSGSGPRAVRIRAANISS